jgi:glycerol kinase
MSDVSYGQSAGTAVDNYFDINKFEQLLNRLEGSKGRQQRQKSLEGRRDTWAQGLASMMSNF